MGSSITRALAWRAVKQVASGPDLSRGAPANPHSPLVSRRPVASRFLKQPRPDLRPGQDIGRVLLMPSDAVIELRPLRIRQRCRVRFQAFPDGIEQFCLLRRGEGIY